jgi:hypothetical protein
MSEERLAEVVPIVRSTLHGDAAASVVAHEAQGEAAKMKEQ